MSQIGKLFKESLLEIAEERETVVREYSGRGMMGKSCIGIVIWPQDSLALMGHIVHRMHVGFVNMKLAGGGNVNIAEWNDFNEGVNEVCQSRPHTDNFGEQMIMYWPEITWEECE